MRAHENHQVQEPCPVKVVVRARNRLDLQLKDLLATVIGLPGFVGRKPISRLPTSAPEL
jgi:5,10-methylene-tetrahydrofolate dehydrogenase/methenyl tetrahydrofolate cyclohydrolase